MMTEYRDHVKGLVDWCLWNYFQINVGETKELVVDFHRRKPSPPAPVNIQGIDIQTVTSYQ